MKTIFELYDEVSTTINTTLDKLSSMVDVADLASIDKPVWLGKVDEALQLVKQHLADVDLYCSHHKLEFDKYAKYRIDDVINDLELALKLIKSEKLTERILKALQDKVHSAACIWDERYMEYFEDWKASSIPAHFEEYFTRPMLDASISISYREDAGKTMNGAFYDHYTVRRITGHNTQVILAPRKTVTKLYEFTYNTVLSLGIGHELGIKVYPAVKDEKNNEEGLLFIPGHSSGGEDWERAAHEKVLINDARKRGQPILAICGGAWKLWENFGGKKRPVTGHNYSSMPRILTGSETFGYMGFNKQIHRIGFKLGEQKLDSTEPPAVATTIVASIMYGANGLTLPATPTLLPKVNSVHAFVPDEKNIPQDLEVSAMALRDDTLAPANRGGVMYPEQTIEAFEAKHGVPMVGIQWHPEAYFEPNVTHSPEYKQHLDILRYMAKAGDAYNAKQKMLREYKKEYASLANPSAFFKRVGIQTNLHALPREEKQMHSDQNNSKYPDKQNSNIQPLQIVTANDTDGLQPQNASGQLHSFSKK